MRRPYRERFTILLSELGAGLAARGPDLNETIRRAVPALRQVDRLLAILAEQRRTEGALAVVLRRVGAAAPPRPAPPLARGRGDSGLTQG